MIWFLIALLASLALLALVSPFLRARAFKPEQGLGAFAGQLDEIKRDLDLGLIDPDEAEASRREVMRRLKSARDAQEEEGGANRCFRSTAIVTSAASVLLAVAAYVMMGSAHLVGLPPQAPPPEIPEEMQQVLDEIDALAADLMQNPANPDGWAVLGQAYLAMGRYAEAAIAFDNAIDYVPDNAFLYASLGQAHLFSQGGNMTPVAQEAFARALEIDPDEPRGRFFMAEALYQSGDVEAAVSAWHTLLADTPEDAGYRQMIEARLDGVETGPVLLEDEGTQPSDRN